MWQDVVLMITSFIFAPSLIVSIVKKIKYPTLTSLPTAIALTAMIIVYASLHLWLAASTTILTASCWYILFFRRNVGEKDDSSL